MGHKLRQIEGIRATSRHNLDKEFVEHGGIIGYKPIEERHIAIVYVSESRKNYWGINFDEISPLTEEYNEIRAVPL